MHLEDVLNLISSIQAEPGPLTHLFLSEIMIFPSFGLLVHDTRAECRLTDYLPLSQYHKTPKVRGDLIFPVSPKRYGLGAEL